MSNDKMIELSRRLVAEPMDWDIASLGSALREIDREIARLVAQATTPKAAIDTIRPLVGGCLIWVQNQSEPGPITDDDLPDRAATLEAVDRIEEKIPKIVSGRYPRVAGLFLRRHLASIRRSVTGEVSRTEILASLESVRSELSSIGAAMPADLVGVAEQLNSVDTAIVAVIESVWGAVGRESAPDHDCTGIAARWCPVHGDCSCRVAEGSDLRTLTDETCPLHRSPSTHARSEGPSLSTEEPVHIRGEVRYFDQRTARRLLEIEREIKTMVDERERLWSEAGDE